MSLAFVFPGQGSQFVGMGKDLLENFQFIKYIFEEVDEAVEKKLSKIIFEGPQEELTLTINTQPALMTISMAILEILKKEGFEISEKVRYFAGHSLGEYSALCGTNAFSLKDTAKLLSLRGKAMQEATPFGKGAMAAIIGMDENLVETLCQEASKKGICQIANDNGGQQIVISGEKEAIDFALTLAKEKGAKRGVLLPVSAPFHSEMMQPAADKMKEALEKVSMQKPLIPVVSNVSVKPETDILKIKSLLIKQVTGRVRWRETIEWFSQNAITKIYEIGAGKVLTGLTKRIDKNIETFNLSSYEDVKDFLKNLN